MKKLFLSLAVCLGIAGSLRANLGETDAQILSRYGKMLGAPTSMTNRDVTKYFLYKDAYIVTVTLIDGQSQREAYSKKDSHEVPPPMTDAELSSLMEPNSMGSKWTAMSDNKTNKVWMLDSKEALASYDKTEHILTLETRMMVQFNNALKALGDKQQNH